MIDIPSNMTDPESEKMIWKSLYRLKTRLDAQALEIYSLRRASKELDEILEKKRKDFDMDRWDEE